MATNRATTRAGRLALALGAALLVMGAAGRGGSVRADEPAKELTEEERAKLAKQAQELNAHVVAAYRDGNYAAATELAEKALEIQKRLYPADKYPDGHPDLATSLNNLGFLLQARGEYGRAEPYVRDTLEMRKRLYPADKYPDGHPDLAASLNNLGALLKDMGEYGNAETYVRDALGMYKRLYPAAKYPDGHPDLATSINNLGFLLMEMGEYGKAEPYYRDALEMRKRLYPAAKYPDGHPDLALSLSNLGALLKDMGEYGKAEPYYRDALEMYKRLYPADKYPDGHPDLATSLNNQGSLLDDMGEYGKAEPYCRDALEMCKRLYPVAKYPNGHPDLARSLSNLGFLLMEIGEYGKAEPYYRDALEMYKRLYPVAKYPDGHPHLATSLSNLGVLLDEMGEYGRAEPYHRDALEMRKRLYPAAKYPGGHPDLALSLNNLGALLLDMGEYGKAEPYYRDALDMSKRLYPAAKYPDGHPDLARSLSNLGALLLDMGEYGKAEPYYRDALEMRKRLYPADKFADGHPDLALSLNNLGALLKVMGEYGKAEPYYRDALEMYKRLYPVAKYPDGHPDLALSLNNQGILLFDMGEYGRAEPYYRDALEMYKRLYPADNYPDGHPDLATSLNNQGGLLFDMGEYGRAEPYYRDALAMRRKLYPADKYPDGHPDLAGSLNNLGALLNDIREYGKATDALALSVSMYERQVAIFADGGAEAEILNLSACLPHTRNLFLAAASQAKGAQPANQYTVLWPGKSALARGLQRRRLLLQAAAVADEATRTKVQSLIGVRQDLARLVLAAARPGDAERARVVQELTEKKEQLEKELAALLPPADRKAPAYTDLADHLPDHAAFMDLYRYADWDPKTRKWDDGHYAAFVVAKGRPVRCVELAGTALAIEKDLRQWRDDINKGLRSDAAGRLRVSVWEPIAKALDDDVKTVYLCPDAELSTLPWPALPGDKDGEVLLEKYAFAVVPGGPSLLDLLTTPAPARRGPDVLLAVGGVRYDRDAPAGKPWRDLPATVRERDAVTAAAGKLAKPPAIIERSGADADVAHLLKDLPTVRWAHLATHGFFAAPESKEREHLFRPDDFLMGVGRERRGPAARNPLTLSGLVLAGANQPTDADGSVLTGEAIAGLNLDDMDLAVLSACQTGLGEAAAGEGVFGLQRAFHIAGCKNVVASLWKVDDDATAALMNLFYVHLWQKNEPPLKALHHAQLELYRNPTSIPKLARGLRDADFSETVELVTKPPADPKAPATRPAAVKDWAAFVLSGAGR